MYAPCPDSSSTVCAQSATCLPVAHVPCTPYSSHPPAQLACRAVAFAGQPNLLWASAGSGVCAYDVTSLALVARFRLDDTPVHTITVSAHGVLCATLRAAYRVQPPGPEIHPEIHPHNSHHNNAAVSNAAANNAAANTNNVAANNAATHNAAANNAAANSSAAINAAANHANDAAEPAMCTAELIVGPPTLAAAGAAEVSSGLRPGTCESLTHAGGVAVASFRASSAPAAYRGTAAQPACHTVLRAYAQDAFGALLSRDTR